MREAAGSIFSLSQTLLDEASHLANGFENLASGRTLDTVGGYVLGLLALASIILIGLVMVREPIASSAKPLKPTNATSRRSCACSTRSRNWPTAT